MPATAHASIYFDKHFAIRERVRASSQPDPNIAPY